MSQMDQYIPANKIQDVLASHYERGQRTASECVYITISVNNVWGGRTKDGGALYSYEKIGYHSGSVEFLRGAYEAKAEIRVYRTEDYKDRTEPRSTFDSFEDLKQYIGV